MEKPRISESLLEFLKENQKTVNHVLRLSSGEEMPYHYPKPQVHQTTSSNNGSASLSAVLEKMSELIELNKVTLQTIDLLDKRIKRMYAYMGSGKTIEQEEAPAEEGEKVEYKEEE